MAFYKFKKNDLFYNQLVTNPKFDWHIYNRKVYLNNTPELPGQNVSNVGHVNVGHINLYEINVDRQTGDLVAPFVTKDGSLTSFKTVSTTAFNSDFSYGDTISGSYPLSASISKDHYTLNSSRAKIDALRNIFNYYTPISPHYAYSSSMGFGDKSTQELGIINIPSILYGSSIKKGSVDLRFYVTGTLVGRAQDIRQNGELVQTEPTTGSLPSGSIVGLVLYNEGFIILTSSQDITNGRFTETYVPGESAEAPQWIHFGATGSSTDDIPNSSFHLSYEGVQKINTINMFCHAPKGELNWSNNPTYIKHGEIKSANSSSFMYSENKNIQIKNIVKTNYSDPTGSFKKITYISQVGIYDKDKNLIGIAKLATPLRKREIDNYSIKLKLDI